MARRGARGSRRDRGRGPTRSGRPSRVGRHPGAAHGELRKHGAIAAPGETFRLVQFTSGSPGPPRAIELDGPTLAANIAAILERVAPRAGDATVSWLPLSHDMGLIGMLLSSLVAADSGWPDGGDLVLIPPEQFLRDPSVWFHAMSTWRATFTAAPDFGYRLAMRSVPSATDLSLLRNAILGGEIIRASTLTMAADRLSAVGLAPAALAPAYGLAEVGLAVAITGPDEEWRAVAGPDGAQIALSGRPLAGYSVEVAPRDGRLSVRAPAVGRDASTRVSVAGSDGVLLTGDTGFLTPDGTLCVTGRIDDTIVVHGRNVFAPALEAALSAVPGVRDGRTTAVGLATDEWVVAVEVDRGAAPDVIARISREVRRVAARAVGLVPDHIALVRPGASR